nr:hypothetical protein BCU57_15325 [Shewanella sp. 10N.286.48.B5]
MTKGANGSFFCIFNLLVAEKEQKKTACFKICILKQCGVEPIGSLFTLSNEVTLPRCQKNGKRHFTGSLHFVYIELF